MAVEPQLLAAWCRMWARSRGVSPPEWDSGALRTQVDLPGQKARWVFPQASAQVRQLAENIGEPENLIKVCASRAEVEPLLPEGWEFGAARFFMTATIDGTAPPANHPITLIEEPWGLEAVAMAPDGSLTGRAGLLIEDDLATIDRLIVDERFRGRGIGRALVARLHQEATQCGARRSALVATEAGRPVYERFGWSVLSDYTTAEFRGRA